ncbi:hypothetical protein F5Y06DRAFT_306157 [Hypoxylon sp. FL0890]|nr:hypothetical protein F5Y06DRAFT_306157 [Hypoxylon sp. FL0890]
MEYEMENETYIESLEARFMQDIEKMYKERSPFFNRIRLRRLADELGLHRQGLLQDNKIVLKNLRGEDVEFILDPDQPTIFEDRRCNHGDRRRGPYIYYRDIQKMIDRTDMKRFDVRQAFLPFIVMYPNPDEACFEYSTPGAFPHHFIAEELSVILDITRQKWETCAPYYNIKRTIQSRQPELCNVSKIVGFACGTLSYGRYKEDFSLTQHAMILSLRRILTKMKPGNTGFRATVRQLLSNGEEFDAMDNVVRCIVQDPAYTDLDKEVLKAEGFTIEDDPRGFLSVDDKTVVVSIDANTPVKQIICDIARPVAIIQMIEKKEPNGKSARNYADPSSPRVNAMLADEYVRVPLDHHPRIRTIEMYVRKGPQMAAGTGTNNVNS